VSALVLIWQTSHVGEPVNEWADMMCDKFGVDDDYPVPRGKISFASIIFPDHRGPAQAYAMRGMSRVVAQRLRSRVQDTILRDPDEHVKLLGITPEAQQINAMRSQRGGVSTSTSRTQSRERDESWRLSGAPLAAPITTGGGGRSIRLR
jgi:hypothetical protein